MLAAGLKGCCGVRAVAALEFSADAGCVECAGLEASLGGWVACACLGLGPSLSPASNFGPVSRVRDAYTVSCFPDSWEDPESRSS